MWHILWTGPLADIILKIFFFYSELLAATNCRGGIINCSGVTCSHFRIQFCLSYQHSKCLKKNCHYVHVSKGEELTYRQTGKITGRILEQLLIKGQHPNSCLDFFIRNRCTYNQCTKLHFSAELDKVKCPVCLEEIRHSKLSALTCNHKICTDCAALLETNYGSSYSVSCPICRQGCDILQLS